MTAARRSTSGSIKVQVMANSRPKAVVTTPVRTPQAAPAVTRRPVKATVHPLQRLPLATRRRLLWWGVSFAALLLVAGYITLLPYQLKGNTGGKKILTDIASIFRGLRGSNSSTQSVEEKEIQDLREQIFPAFQ